MARRRDYIIVVAILAIGWTFWLQRMGVNDFDDMLSNELIFARQGAASLLFNNPWPDQSPLYFLFLHGVRAFGESAFTFQFVNAVVLTLTLTSTYLFGLEFSGSRTVAAAAMFLGAVSPTSLWLVRNGRMYSLQVLFSVLASLFVLRYLDRRHTRDLMAFALLSVLNVYNHFVGFLITALLFVPLAISAWLEAWRGKRERSVTTWAPVRRLAWTAVGVLLLTVPQVVRFARLVGRGAPVRNDVSLPALSPQFLGRVSWFWFVNADWGSLRPADQVVTAVYVGSVLVLAAGGLAAVRRRTGLIAALWIVLPLVGVGLTAARMDVRDRYFVWTLPLLWNAVATGAFGVLPWRRLTAGAAEVARGFRAALMVAVVAGSLWLLWNKLPERYSQWTKLMTGLGEIYRPSMMVYMAPSSPIGTPRLLATQLEMPAGLQDIRDLSADTHNQFLKEVERGQDFIFLLYWNIENDEMRWRSRHLEERKYRKASLSVFGASAQIFTRGDVDGLWQEQRLAPDTPLETVVAWARQQLRHETIANAPALADAVVARMGADGIVRKARLFMTQHGENGSWRFGPQEFDEVEEVRASSGGVAQNAILTHPAGESVLVVAFPALKMNRSLKLSYGITDSALAVRSVDSVKFGLYVDGEKKLDASCPNTPGWRELAAETSSVDGKAADIVMVIAAPRQAARHFAFRLDLSSRPAPPRALNTATAAGPVVLGGDRTLREFVDRLRVYRLEGDRRIDALSDGRGYSAEEMHEATGSAGEGAVRRRWALGRFPWDGVGVTRQRSGGDVRDGLWAHPRNGTTLVVEVPAVTLGLLLRGHFGLTDYAVANAKAAGVTAPVTFRVLVDGRSVFEQAAARTAGWIPLAIPVDGGNREHALRIEISSARDSWAHFIFDLWSD